METIPLGKVLKTLCERLHITKNNNKTVTYKMFRSAMFGSRLIASAMTVRNKWIIINNTDYLVEHRGERNNTEFVILDTEEVERIILSERETLPSNWEEPCYTHSIYTQTTTEEESQ